MQVLRAHWAYARIIRATLQDCRLGRLWGHPRETSRYRRAWPLPCLSREAVCCTIVLQTLSKPSLASMGGMLHEQSLRPDSTVSALP